MTEDDLKKLLASQTWIFAKTMPENPHEYALREKWVGDDESFINAVLFIREHGYRNKFKWRWYTQIDLDGFTYWTMGSPLDATRLINRKKIIKAVFHPW